MHVPRRNALSLIETVLALAILVGALVPLTDLMVGTRRGAHITQDHVVALNLAQLVVERVTAAADADSEDAFDRLPALGTPAGSVAPNGCPGQSISGLARPGESLMPADGEADFDPATGAADWKDIFARFSFTAAIRPATDKAREVLRADGKPTLARVDVSVFWKDPQDLPQSVDLSSYVSRRRH